MYIVNVYRKPSAPITSRRKTVHHPCCRYATLSRRWYEISAGEVLRLHGRIRNGDGGGTRICKLCRPDRLIGMMIDPT